MQMRGGDTKIWLQGKRKQAFWRGQNIGAEAIEGSPRTTQNHPPLITYMCEINNEYTNALPKCLQETYPSNLCAPVK